MVMFKEDDERIKAEQKKGRNKIFVWFRRLVFTGFALVCLFFLCIAVLSALSGQKEQLEIGIKKFVMEATGLEAEIGELAEIKMYPDFKAAVKDIKLMKKTGEEAASIGTFNVTMPFMSLVFGAKKLESLEIKDVKADAGVFTPRALQADELTLQPEGYEGSPAIIGKGKYGSHPFNLTFLMEGKPYKGDRKTYSIGDDRLVLANIGDLSFKGRFSGSGGGKVSMNIEHLGTKDNFLTGEAELRRSKKKQKIEGEFKKGKSVIKVDTVISEGRTAGDMTFDPLYSDDIPEFLALQGSLFEMLAAEGSSGKPMDFGEATVNMDIKVKRFSFKDVENAGNFSFPLVIKDKMLNAGPLSGEIYDGKLSGKIEIDAKQSPANMKINSGLKGWDYARLQRDLKGLKNVEGKADVKIALTSTGANFGELMNRLKGEAAFIAGNGKMESKALNFWGSGLINAIIPDLDPESETTLNCAIAAFKVENSIATAQPLFFDTKRVTMKGEGTINLVDKKIDLTLTPKSKNPALLDVSSSVNVRGDLFKPSIAPDTVSLLGTIGGLALGFVNPAFLAFSLTDLGLTDSHPCKDFIGNKEEDKAKAEDKKASNDNAAPSENVEAEAGKALNE